MARLEGVVDLADAVPEDVGEAEQDRQLMPRSCELIDQFLQVDRAQRILGRVDVDVAVVADREVALAPALDFVELGRFGGGPVFAHVVRRTHTAARMIHAEHDSDLLTEIP